MRQSKDYQSHIKAIVTAFQAGQPLSPKALVAMRRDLSAYERGIDSKQRWQQAAKELGYPKEQCQRIQRMTELYRQGYPLPELAAIAMHKDLSSYEQQQLQLRVQEKLERMQQEHGIENKLSLEHEQGNEYE